MNPVYCRQRSVYDAGAKYADLLPEVASWNAGTSVKHRGHGKLPDTLKNCERSLNLSVAPTTTGYVVAAKLSVRMNLARGRDEKAWIEHIWEQTRGGDAGRKSAGFRHAADPSASVQKRHLSPLKTIFAIRKIIRSRRRREIGSSRSASTTCSIRKSRR